MMTLAQQMADANREVRKLKRWMPGMFPEYSRLLIARKAFKAAQKELAAAEAAWKKVGHHK